MYGHAHDPKHTLNLSEQHSFTLECPGITRWLTGAFPQGTISLSDPKVKLNLWSQAVGIRTWLIMH